MDAARLHRVEAIFQEVVAEPPDKRAAILEQRCASDMEVRDLVLQLLNHDSNGMGGFMRQPVIGSHWSPPADQLPKQVGTYRIIRQLGHGGMGVVFEAEQETPHRTVAVKLIRAGMTGRDSVRRFQYEAEVLGQLQHPGIAQIFEAGTTRIHGDTGAEVEQPFLAMELVRGEALTAFADKHGLRQRDRLELIARICDAVHHAHQKGVIHRDLKPANILVGEAGPKVLDFGVAKATRSDLRAVTLETAAGQFLGTVPYMSPEQLGANGDAVDTRSDVYALGVIAYEFLTGRAPFDVADKSLPQAIKMICEETAPRAGAIRVELAGDVEAILGKAIEKEPDRRYASAAEMAADVRRFLRHEPISARPPSAWYQMGRFAKRNKGTVIAGAAAVLILIAGAIVSVTFATGKARALGESERQRKIAQSVNEFLNNDLLGKANPNSGGSHDITMREVLDGAAKSIENRFQNEPLVNASIRETLGRAFYQLGAYEESQKQIEPAIRIFQEQLGPQDVKAYELRHMIALEYLYRWKLDEAVAVLDPLLADVERNLGKNHELTARVHGVFGILRKRQGRFAKSEEAYRRAIEIYEHINDVPLRSIAITKENLALVLHDQHRYAEAEQIMLEAKDLMIQASGEDSADMGWIWSNLGPIIWKGHPGKEGLRRARDCFEKALHIRVKLLGEEHRETLRTKYSLADVYYDEGDYATAESLSREVLESRLKLMEDDHVDVLDSHASLAKALKALGRVDEAREHYYTAWSRGQARYGPEHFHPRRWRDKLLAFLREQGDRESIHDVYVEYFAALAAAAEKDDATTDILNAWAWHLLYCEAPSLRDPERAIELAQRGVESGKQDDPNLLDTLARAQDANGMTEEAVATIDRAIDILEGDDEVDVSSVADYRATRGMLLAKTGRFEQAIATLNQALDERVQAVGERDVEVGLSLSALASVELESGDAAHAIESAQQAIDILRTDEESKAKLATALVTLAEARMRLGQANDDVKSLIDEAIEIRQSPIDEHEWRLAEANLALARWLALNGRPADGRSIAGIIDDELDCTIAIDQFKCARVRAEAADLVDASP